MVREAFNCIDEGLATPEDVDKAVRFTFGMRIMGAGPILQKELAGLETQVAAAQRAAKLASVHSGRVWARIATLSPGWMPRSTSPSPISRTVSPSSS